MSEIQRFQFLAKRDGFSAAIDFERRTAAIYRKRAEMALGNRQEAENKCIARGKEWAIKYYRAAMECEAVVDCFNGPIGA